MINNKKVSIGLILEVSALIIILIFLIASLFLPVPEGMGDKGLTTLAVILLCIVLWLTNVIPAGVTGMLVIVLFSAFNILDFSQAAGNIGKEIIWLLIAMFLMGQAVETTGLHKRVAYNMFILAKGNLRLIVLLMMLFTFMLTFFIPNVLGRMMLILPISIGLVNSIKQQGYADLGRVIIPTITFVPFISAFSVITGGGGTLYAVHLFEVTAGKNWGYVEWLIVMLPLGLAVILLFWLAVTALFMPFHKAYNVNQDYFLEEKSKFGKITFEEIQIAVLYFFLLVLWITSGLHGFSMAMSAILIASLLFIPKIGLLKWKEAIPRMEWSILFIFAAGFSIADALEASEVTGWISMFAEKHLSSMTAFSVASAMLLVLIVLRIGFINYTMMIAFFMPLVFTFAGITELNPIWLGMISIIGSSICFFFPIQTVSGMAAFSQGYHTSKDHFIIGLILTVISVIAALFCAFYYWPLVGLSIYQ